MRAGGRAGQRASEVAVASLARSESGRTNVPELTLCKREREGERESKQGGLSIDGRTDADGLPKYNVAVVAVGGVAAPKAAFQNISASDCDCLSLLF